jgi:CD109 antigen
LCALQEKILSDFKINAEFLNSQNQSVTVTSIKKDFSVFIQTDKAIYKPGDKIRMRIFFLEPTGLPVSTKNLKTFRIEIRNSYNQLIQQHTHTYVKKVYKKSMNLSSNCFIGKYKILIWKNIHYEEDNVDPDDESKEITDDGDEELSNDENTNPYEIENAIKIQEFEVKKLVLPEFEVKIETDRYVRHKENIKLKIYALYKFGKFASGNATVIATIRSSDKILRKVKKEIYIETAENLIISQSKEELDVRNDILQYDVNIVVSFEERLTKQTLTASTTVSIVNSDKFQLVIYPEHENFVPGQNLKVDVYVREIDGKFLETSYKYVEFKTKMNFKTKLCEKIILNAKQYLIKSEPPKRIIDKKATFNIKVPDNTTSIEITATYATFSETFNIFRKNSMTREYLTMKV